MFQKASEVVEQIEKRRHMTKGIDHFHAYMKSLQSPHLAIPCIHVAGTNGKGSTCHYISNVLQSLGYRVGTFTSPYLYTHFDRIQINGQNIPENTFLTIANHHYEEWVAHELNMFEIDMCIASLYFQSQAVDFVIYEVGLGGRYDATNIVSPLVSVITNIGLDHMQILGDSYEAITREKAGIIKEQGALITGEEKETCLSIIKKQCEQKNSTYQKVDAPYHIRVDDHCHFSYRHIRDITLSSNARYQIENACCALEVLFYLDDKGYLHLTKEAIYEGLYKAHWQGRFDKIAENPDILVDGAHNVEGIRALVKSLSIYQNPKILFSASSDKHIVEMIEILKESSNQIHVCCFENERSLSYDMIKELKGIQYEEDYKRFIDQAMQGKDCVVITGSLYFVSEVLSYIKTKS